ncbi:MAG: hypothetical protein ABJA81_09040 [Nocardioidaceae bacterium]
MLPYPSYLRVYEPLDALSPAVQQRLGADADRLVDPGLTVAAEQDKALERAVNSAALAIDTDQLSGSYVLRREGRSFFCPIDLPLRSWLSLTSLVESIGGATAKLLFTADSLANADQEFLRWRRDHPTAVPHIRQTTWGIPRTWFVLVAEDEREVYDAGGVSSVRYRARIVDARRRVAGAHSVLRKVIDEAELLDEMVDLDSWLESFDENSWIELDYAGVARLLGDAVASDQSAREIHRALKALRKGDFATAGEAYRAFEDRWRIVNAYERAN